MKNVPKKPKSKKSLLKAKGPRIAYQLRHTAGPMVKRLMDHYGITRKEATREVLKHLRQETTLLFPELNK